ncbi:hypothetical protein GCM10008949_51660 [Deinococcus humi]|nr:hypothetical protein GCM10008949_51660 [Deinococcus humi]
MCPPGRFATHATSRLPPSEGWDSCKPPLQKSKASLCKREAFSIMCLLLFGPCGRSVKVPISDDTYGDAEQRQTDANMSDNSRNRRGA